MLLFVTEPMSTLRHVLADIQTFSKSSGTMLIYRFVYKNQLPALLTFQMKKMLRKNAPSLGQ